MRNTNSQLVSQLTTELAVQRNRLADTQTTISDLYVSLRNLATNQVKVINPAEAASADLPNTWLDVGVAMVAALLLCLTLVLGIDYFTDSLRRPEDLAQATDVPVLGVIPKHAPLRRLGPDAILVNSMPKSVASENLRVLSAKLFAVGGFRDLKGSAARSNETSRARSFLFCSLDQGTDAVEIAANLALILVHSGRRVILCDANLRSTLATRLFEFTAQKGMTEALSSESPDPSLVPVSWAPGLMMLPAGAHTTLAFELLASPRMLELNDWLITHADVVLYIGAPVKEFADDYALAPRVDEVILIRAPSPDAAQKYCYEHWIIPRSGARMSPGLSLCKIGAMELKFPHLPKLTPPAVILHQNGNGNLWEHLPHLRNPPRSPAV